MTQMLSGRTERFPYSLSRWTDLPAAKWPWFQQRLSNGWMLGVHPRTGIPVPWSLSPDDTMGLVFWTRDARNLIEAAPQLAAYQKTIQYTLTGWAEVEKGSPSIDQALETMGRTVDAFGADRVTWRFSPVPMVTDVLDRFTRIARGVERLGIQNVFVAFLQSNDLLAETRDPAERSRILKALGEATSLRVKLCAEDSTPAPDCVPRGICEPGAFAGASPPAEGCGCALTVDPFTINESCTFGCAYCLHPDTPVLYADYVWRPLKDVKVGDKLLAFDEEAPVYRGDRKFREAVVEAKWSSLQPTIRLTTEHASVVTTPNHLWFEGKTRKAWKRTDHLALDCKLHHISVTPNYDFTRDYKLGYIAGMTLGDGTFRYTPGQSHNRKEKQPYWRVALADLEPLERLKEYMLELGADVEIRPFDPGSSGYKGTKPMFKVETRKLEALSSIHTLLALDPDSFDFRRGFLAGVFDSEGSYSGKNLRIHQTKKNGLLDKVERYANNLGVSMTREKKGVRVTGTLQGKIRLFSLLRPALAKKTIDLIGRAIDFTKVPILAIEQAGVQEMIDIQTSTHTFIAGGLATHNCYAADKQLAPKKRNTTHLRVVT